MRKNTRGGRRVLNFSECLWEKISLIIGTAKEVSAGSNSWKVNWKHPGSSYACYDTLFGFFILLSHNFILGKNIYTLIQDFFFPVAFIVFHFDELLNCIMIETRQHCTQLEGGTLVQPQLRGKYIPSGKGAPPWDPLGIGGWMDGCNDLVR